MCSPVMVSMAARAFQKTEMLARVSTRSRGLRGAAC
jgi:hypothetical protein